MRNVVVQSQDSADLHISDGAKVTCACVNDEQAQLFVATGSGEVVVFAIDQVPPPSLEFLRRRAAT